jgi:hypothetical protein
MTYFISYCVEARIIGLIKKLAPPFRLHKRSECDYVEVTDVDVEEETTPKQQTWLTLILPVLPLTTPSSVGSRSVAKQQ